MGFSFQAFYCFFPNGLIIHHQKQNSFGKITSLRLPISQQELASSPCDPYFEILLEENAVAYTQPRLRSIYNRYVIPSQRLFLRVTRRVSILKVAPASYFGRSTQLKRKKKKRGKGEGYYNMQLNLLTSTNILFRFIIAIGIPRHLVVPYPKISSWTRPISFRRSASSISQRSGLKT